MAEASEDPDVVADQFHSLAHKCVLRVLRELGINDPEIVPDDVSLLHVEREGVEGACVEALERIESKVLEPRARPIYVLEIVGDGFDRRRTCRPLCHPIKVDHFLGRFERREYILVRIAKQAVGEFLLSVVETLCKDDLCVDQ